MMRAQIRRLHSPDVDDLVNYVPEEDDVFGFLLQILVGPDDGAGEESFDVMLCSPKWLLQRYPPGEVINGRHMLIMQRYEYGRLYDFLQREVAAATGETWSDVAKVLSKIGRCEFDDYMPLPRH